jgi:hypothetical protein
LAYGQWHTAQLLEAWEHLVQEEQVFHAHQYGSYRPGEWPPSCQAASSRADSEAVSVTGGAGAVITNCPRLSHCWASQLLQS